MKKLLLITLVMGQFASVKAQQTITDTIPKIDGSFGYQEVISLDSAFKKPILFTNAKLYFVNNFKSAKDVIQYENFEDGKIIGKGLLTAESSNFSATFNWAVYFTTEITCKDGKYRYRIYDINIKETRYVSGSYGGTFVHDMSIDEAIKQTQKGSVKKPSIRMFNQMVSKFQGDIASIKEDMAKKSQIAKKDDF